jgi:hypothetical protein
MARDHLGYEYTEGEDSSWMPSEDVDDDVIIERLGKVFKDMPAYMPWSMPEYSAVRPPNEVSSRG